jgi:hypothetical protein
MALTKITTGEITDGTITSADIATGTITSADMAVDPTNASNLSSGSVPLAQLGNAPATDTSNIESDIALLGFRIAANGSLSKYNLVDQTEDAFTDQIGIDASTSTNEVYNVAGKYFTGQIANPVGGTETTYSDGGTDYVIRSFLSGTTNFVIEKAGTVDYLLVAGGGGGSTGGIGGGGGGGGFLTATGSPLAIGSHPVVVGAGGATWLSAAATTGGDTTFNSLTAVGGGGGVGHGGTQVTGGSGGGGHGYGGTGGSATPGQGNNGGPGAPGGGSYGAGGGGGAGAVGATGVTPSGGNGGVGLSNSLRTNSGVFYAGGGGGLKWTGSQGAGGNGGGGAATNGTGTAGTVNTGGGGGGGTSGAGGIGGSGIAVIRFVADSLGPVYNQLTLVSNSTTALTAPTKGDIVMTYTDGVGTATLNTDLTAEFSADDGSTWTSTTLVAQGNTGSASPHLIVAAHDVTRTSTSGTSMRYRIKTLNQTVSKETRIQAVSLGWS